MKKTGCPIPCNTTHAQASCGIPCINTCVCSPEIFDLGSCCTVTWDDDCVNLATICETGCGEISTPVPAPTPPTPGPPVRCYADVDCRQTPETYCLRGQGGQCGFIGSNVPCSNITPCVATTLCRGVCAGFDSNTTCESGHNPCGTLYNTTCTGICVSNLATCKQKPDTSLSN